jgi:hypothetical protein
LRSAPHFADLRCGTIEQITQRRGLRPGNAGYLGEYFDRAIAMTRVEETIGHHMKAVLEDWELYRAIKDNRAI